MAVVNADMPVANADVAMMMGWADFVYIIA